MASRTQKSKIRWSGRAPRTVAGLLSGTSADGIAAVIVRISGRGNSLSLKQLAFSTIPYPPGMQQTILANSLPGTGNVDLLTSLHAAIGKAFSDALKRTAKRAGIPFSRIELIGSHGQTVHHLPEPLDVHGWRVRSSLQIGDPSVIAQETRIPVVGDFRTADMAVGGQGAPLVPLLDYYAFRSRSKNRLLLNLGGIANITSLPKGCSLDDVIAFDTGPANMVIDALVKSRNGKPFDRGGRIARSGRVLPELLSRMMSIDYFRRPPPKSTGREMFGAGFIAAFLERKKGIRAEDLIATATEFTALSIYDQYVRYIRPTTVADELLVSGGGVHNTFLMGRLGELFGNVPVATIPDAGFSADAKEAVLFALLAYLTVLGKPSNLPRVSGATRPVILGKICVP